MKNILLISYSFPPYPGIGGRRWAKFAKYLSRLGYIVHVIHAKNPFHEQSLWLSDVEGNENIRRYELESSYPSALVSIPETFFEKVRYKFALKKTLLFTKGTPYDRGVFWKDSMLSLAENLIMKYQINNVIVSCAPFSCAYYALQLKKIFKELNLMVDLRDPWTWGSGYGFSHLNYGRLKYEKIMENSVIEGSDRIFVPVEVMKEHLASVYQKHSDKIVVLPHAFDPEEIPQKEKPGGETIRIVFYGTLYDGITGYLSAVGDFLKSCSNNIELQIYSDSEKYSDIFEQKSILNKKVFYNGSVPSPQVFQKIKSADFVLMIHPDYGIHNISTKFYEVIYSGTPILYLSKPGLAADFIEKNKVGFFIQENEIGMKFMKIISETNSLNYKPDFDINPFSFDGLSRKLVKNYFS